MATPEISVCVAVHKRHRAPNLASLNTDLDAALGGCSGELIAVLNGIDADAAGLPARARSIVFPENRGVPIAWNAAARAATGRTLVVVNDDVVLGPKSLRVLRDALDELPNAGVVGPVGTQWDLERARHLEYVDTAGLQSGEGIPCNVLSGFLLVTPRSVFERVGGFDERLTPCSFEEVDYCTAVRRRLGLECYVVAGVDVRHDFRISARRPWWRIRYMGRSESLGTISSRNRAHFIAKWSGTGPAGP